MIYNFCENREEIIKFLVEKQLCDKFFITDDFIKCWENNDFETALKIRKNTIIQAEKEFAKSRLEGTPSNMTFYLDHYEEVNKMGRAAYKYVQLRHIYETPTNFYLMLNDKQGAIVEKANCKPELIKFIGKIKAQYKL